MTKKEALTRHKLAQHKPNMNAYVVFANETAARRAAAELNGFNLSLSWNLTRAHGLYMYIHAYVYMLMCSTASTSHSRGISPARTVFCV